MMGRMVRTTALRWTAPALAAAAVAAVTLAPRAAAQSPHPTLPAKSPAALLAAVEQAHVQAFTGTIRTIAALGLPQLPDYASGGGTGWQALMTGTHRLRVWVDGPQRQRVALLGDVAETDVVHSGHDVWTWASSTSTVTHSTLPAHTSKHRADVPASAADQLTPQAQATKALDAVNPSTIVTVDRTARVAGRPAYQLVLTPRTAATLVGSVRIAIDAATSVPLRVQVFSRGASTPAFQTAFTAINFHAPAAGVFRFTPPRGSHFSAQHPSQSTAPTTDRHQRTAPTTVGTGWSSILVLPAGTLDLQAAPTRGSGRGSSAALLNDITTAVPQGRLLTTKLLSALITPDGRVLIGAVPPSALEQAAGA